MIFQQCYLESLGHPRYLIGLQDTGEALVPDPRRDVEVYLAAAHEQGLQPRFSVETPPAQRAARMPIEVLTGRRGQIHLSARQRDDEARFEMGALL